MSWVSVRPVAYLSFYWALHPSVTVAKGEATSETKVSEKERRFPAPAGAASSFCRSGASGSAPAALDGPPSLFEFLETKTSLPRPARIPLPPTGVSTPIPPGSLLSLLLISLLPLPAGLGSLPRKQLRLGFPEAPPLPLREFSD
uniref:Uncharacterized protein n=1 Tax=Molossus molossus TaxID=27622 RepID=A0A7J8J0W6_MOLMO|nr:hypothetical protein HJG59_010415 [Molossus molossus]